MRLQMFQTEQKPPTNTTSWIHKTFHLLIYNKKTNNGRSRTDSFSEFNSIVYTTVRFNFTPSSYYKRFFFFFRFHKWLILFVFLSSPSIHFVFLLFGNFYYFPFFNCICLCCFYFMWNVKYFSIVRRMILRHAKLFSMRSIGADLIRILNKNVFQELGLIHVNCFFSSSSCCCWNK